jgi:hypothetical protein
MKAGEDTSRRRPTPAAHIHWEAGPDGRVHLRRRKFGPVGTAVLRAFRIRPDLTVQLDAIGSEVWQLLDGRTVAAVLQALQERHPDEEDLPERLGHYLSVLASNRFIRLE